MTYFWVVFWFVGSIISTIVLLCFGASRLQWGIAILGIIALSIPSYYLDKEESEKRKIVEHYTEVRQYQLMGYNPPKHFYVTLRDTKTDQVYKNVYVSKHCNHHRNNTLLDNYSLSITVWSRAGTPDDRQLRFNGLYDAFCQ